MQIIRRVYDEREHDAGGLAREEEGHCRLVPAGIVGLIIAAVGNASLPEVEIEKTEQLDLSSVTRISVAQQS
jgi:hypothetical protein